MAAPESGANIKKVGASQGHRLHAHPLVGVHPLPRDGRIEIDNNAAERALRAVALGRKNYLFCGSDSGGERAAAMYSLIGTAKLNGLDPQAYLRYVIERIADHPVNRIEELLPWNVAAALRSDRALELAA
jgi:transposase